MMKSRNCQGCGGVDWSVDDRGILKCNHCGKPYNESYKDIQKVFETYPNISSGAKSKENQADFFKVVDQCFNEHYNYSPRITQIIEYITSKKDFSLAYKALERIAGFDMDKLKKIDMVLCFVDEMEVVIQEEICPSRRGLTWRSFTWGKGFRHDDYIKYCDIAIKYRRKRGK